MFSSSRSSEDNSAETTAAVLTRTVNAFAYLTEAMLHKNMGLRYADANILFSLGVLLIYAFFWPGHDLRPLGVFAYVFVVAHIWQRLAARGKRLRSDRPHSYYSGTSLLWRLFPWVTERTMKRLIEPWIVVIVGALSLSLDQPVGVLLMISGCAMMVSNEQASHREQEQAIAMHDAFLENRMVAERFRDQFGDFN